LEQFLNWVLFVILEVAGARNRSTIYIWFSLVE